MSETRSEPRLAPIVAVATPTWARSAGNIAGGIVAILIAAGGLLLGRVDLALLAFPLVAGLAWSWAQRPVPANASVATLTLFESTGTEINFTLTVDAPAGVDAIVLRSVVMGGEAHVVVLAGPVVRSVTGSVPLLHSGPQELIRLEYRFLGTDAGASSAPEIPLIASRVIAPSSTAVASLPLPWRLRGLTGTHESARAGDGGDFLDVHPFAAGDRLRRIDWKATARRGQSAGDLYVRRTAALSDATVLIVLDSRDDVGEQVAEWSRNSAASKA